MKLSIVIVNYNVKHFLEQCLRSVFNSLKHIESEVFVVDNNSADGSCAMVKEKFPNAKLIENKDNKGFAVANNQAIRESKGEYILLLNPDTLVEEDTFVKVVGFMDETPDAGGLGVKMIDGKGNFLPESKRGLPTPMVSFYKIFGLSRIFPKSKTFAKYHLGYLNKEEIHSVDVLCGAFMLLRRKALDISGLLDETFFMYGEDIDLSYRILKAGYKNYYYPKTTIIHYKGESTKKGSINYVVVFYNAMIIFVQKHFRDKNANLFTFFIKLAVYFRASLSVIKRISQNIFQPLLDFILIYSGYYFLLPFWEKFRYNEPGYYPIEFKLYVIPSFIIIWVLFIFFTGGYIKPNKLGNVLKGVITGSVGILLVYSLLPEDLRFSRALILIGSAWTLFVVFISRVLLHFSGIKTFELSNLKRKKYVIVGTPDEVERTCDIIKKSNINSEFLGYVSPNIQNTNSYNSNTYFGNISQLEEIVKINKVDELIFCAKNLSAQEIIRNMLNLSRLGIEYKIAPEESLSIIGSNSIHTSGEFYSIEINSIVKEINIRNKRILDILFSLFFLTFSPLLIFVVKSPLNFFLNIFKVINGKFSWVGYCTDNEEYTTGLPKIKKGILSRNSIITENGISVSSIKKQNSIYAQNYKLTDDIVIIIRGLRNIGQIPSQTTTL